MVEVKVKERYFKVSIGNGCMTIIKSNDNAVTLKEVKEHAIYLFGVYMFNGVEEVAPDDKEISWCVAMGGRIHEM